jgi:hypothetical protein
MRERERENFHSDHFRLVKSQLFSKWNAINQVPKLNHEKTNGKTKLLTND